MRVILAQPRGFCAGVERAIDIVDRSERIEQLLPVLDEMVTEGLITLEDVHVVKYVHSREPQPPGSGDAKG